MNDEEIKSEMRLIWNHVFPNIKDGKDAVIYIKIKKGKISNIRMVGNDIDMV